MLKWDDLKTFHPPQKKPKKPACSEMQFAFVGPLIVGFSSWGLHIP